jgi:ribosome-binding factor A
MIMETRQKRLGELLKKEISDMLTRGIKDPRIGFVSITSIEVSGDLRHAKVFVSVYGSEQERKSTVAGLKSAAGYIRKELGQRLRVRRVPEISIIYDESLERGSRILELIDSVVPEEPDTPHEE